MIHQLLELENQLLCLTVKLELSRNTSKSNAEEESMLLERKSKRSMINGTSLTNLGSQLTNDSVYNLEIRNKIYYLT